MRVLATALLLLALAASAAAARSPVRPATAAETHAIAVAIRQPRFTCFDGLVARGGGWAALRHVGGSGCPELPSAILVRADARLEWREVRRWSTRRAACRARPPGLPRATRKALLGCAKTPR